MSTKIVRNKDEVLHVYANVQDETVTVPDVTFSPATLSIHGGAATLTPLHKGGGLNDTSRKRHRGNKNDCWGYDRAEGHCGRQDDRGTTLNQSIVLLIRIFETAEYSRGTSDNQQRSRSGNGDPNGRDYRRENSGRNAREWCGDNPHLHLIDQRYVPSHIYGLTGKQSNIHRHPHLTGKLVPSCQ